MGIYLLDTCTISDFFKGIGNTENRIRDVSPDEIAISAVTVMEVLYGFELNPASRRRYTKAFESFCTVTEVIPVDFVLAEKATELRAILKTNGTPIGPWDLLIAASACSRNCILVSSNISEFSRVPGLKVESWR